MADVDVELKADLKRLLKKPMRFAFGLKDGQTSYLLLHKTKTARALNNEVRAGKGAKTATFGVASGEGKVLTLEVQGPKMAGLDKRVLVFLRREKLKLYNEILVEYEGEAASSASPVTGEENEALAKLSPEELRKKDLTQRDPGELFQDGYMTKLVGKKMKGANDPRLKEIMRQLGRGASGAKREKLILALATLLEEKAKKLDADYGRFLILRDQQDAIQKQKKKDPVPDLAGDIHGEFMASNPQLVFGKVVGDAFGIHPVFGALLSPTGGMVGPGNIALHLDDDDPTGYHGILHDAAGYLYNYHGQGPGYDYLDQEDRNTGDALTGQQSGMRYWHQKLNPGAGTEVMLAHIDAAYAIKDGVEEAGKLYEQGKKTADEVKIEVEKKLEKARRDAARAFDQAMDEASRKTEQAADALEQAAYEAADAAREAAREAEKSAVRSYEEASKAVGEAAEEVSEKLNAAWDYIWN